MFNVFSKSDKMGNLAINFDGVIGNSGYMNYQMDLPKSGVKIKVKTKNENRSDGYTRTVVTANIKVGRQAIKKEFGNIVKVNEIKDFNMNRLVHAVLAYNYVKQNKPAEAEYFLKGVDSSLSFFENNVNSQKMLDKVFREGNVNLDSLVEAEVDKRLQMNDSYYDRYSSNKLLGKLQSGFAKMLEPLQMAKEKIKDFLVPENDDYYDRF